MNADLLTSIPRKGTIYITDESNREVSFEGWFHVKDRWVMRRGAGDLRSWVLCSLDDVVEFTPDPVQP